MWTNLRDKNFKGTQRRASTFCEIYLQGLNQVLTINTGEKSVPTSGRGRREDTILKDDGDFCFLNKAGAQVKLVNQGKPAAVYQRH